MNLKYKIAMSRQSRYKFSRTAIYFLQNIQMTSEIIRGTVARDTI